MLKNPNLKGFLKILDIRKSELPRVRKATNAYFAILSQNEKCLEKWLQFILTFFLAEKWRTILMGKIIVIGNN